MGITGFTPGNGQTGLTGGGSGGGGVTSFVNPDNVLVGGVSAGVLTVTINNGRIPITAGGTGVGSAAQLAPLVAPYLSLQERLFARAVAALGAAPLHSFFRDFEGPYTALNVMNVTSQFDGLMVNGGGSATAVLGGATDIGGLLELATGATAGSTVNLYGPVCLDKPSSGRGYFAARIRFNSAIDAQTKAGWFFMAPGNVSNIGFGQIGSASTSQIVFGYDSTGFMGGFATVNILPTATLDWHTYEVWWGSGDGKLHVALDFVEVGTGVVPFVASTSALSLWGRLDNGSTAANRGMDTDYIFAATTFAP